MLDQLSPEWFEMRADVHRGCARLAETDDVRRFHEELATRYDRLATESRAMPPLIDAHEPNDPHGSVAA